MRVYFGDQLITQNILLLSEIALFITFNDGGEGVKLQFDTLEHFVA